MQLGYIKYVVDENSGIGGSPVTYPDVMTLQPSYTDWKKYLVDLQEWINTNQYYNRAFGTTATSDLAAAFQQYNAMSGNIDPYWAVQVILPMCTYFATDPNQQMRPGSIWMNTPAAQWRLYQSCLTQWSHDNAPSFFEKMLPLAVLAVAGYAAYLTYTGAAAVGAAEVSTAGQTVADAIATTGTLPDVTVNAIADTMNAGTVSNIAATGSTVAQQAATVASTLTDADIAAYEVAIQQSGGLSAAELASVSTALDTASAAGTLKTAADLTSVAKAALPTLSTVKDAAAALTAITAGTTALIRAKQGLTTPGYALPPVTTTYNPNAPSTGLLANLSPALMQLALPAAVLVGILAMRKK